MKIPDHAYIALTIVLTVTSQILMRWQISMLPSLPEAMGAKLLVLSQYLLRPCILLAVASTFLSGLCWMAALTKFPLSYAFPFLAINFVAILVASAVLFHEPINMQKVIGNLLIVSGVFFLAR